MKIEAVMWVIGAVAVSLLLAGVYNFVYGRGYDASEAKWTALEAKRQQASRDEKDKADRERREMENRQTTLVVALQNKEVEAQALRKEHANEIRKYARNRECLNPDLVRVLNADLDARLPKAPADQGGQPPAGTDAGQASTDTDIANWVNEVKGMYETCAGRLSTWQTLYNEAQLCR